MSSTPFGEHLKRERELRGVSLEEVAAATRISTRFLEAIEREQWDQLPGGVFNRGFIRSVSRFLGLDEDAMVAEYALETKTQTEPRVAAHPVASTMPRDWKPLIIAVSVLVVVLLVGILVIAHYSRRAAARKQIQQSSVLLPTAGGSH